MTHVKLSRIYLLVWFLPLAFSLSSCSADEQARASNFPSQDSLKADIVSVKASGESEDYQFSVGVKSPDLGCNQYANWWEVLSRDGKLLYRRILTHSHGDEQPFVRSGGPVKVNPGELVYVRAYLHPQGFTGNVFEGSVELGFRESTNAPVFSKELETADPQPTGCRF